MRDFKRYASETANHVGPILSDSHGLFRGHCSLQDDPPAGVSGAPTDNNILLWHAVIFGPEDTAFEDGVCDIPQLRICMRAMC